VFRVVQRLGDGETPASQIRLDLTTERPA
jgi:hypothetical protein